MSSLLSRAEAAERLGISHDTLDRLRKDGRIAYIQSTPGGRVRFTEEAIAEYIARTTHPAQPVPVVKQTYRKRRVSPAI